MSSLSDYAEGEALMEKLEFLPQSTVVWGRHVLPGAVAALGDHGIDKPITFTVPPLEPLRRTFVEPNVVFSAGVYTDFPPHAPDFAVRKALEAFAQSGAKSIIALGGGSVLDAAKAVSHFHHLKTGKFIPIAALPTTLSGSEFSHFFGVTETQDPTNFKRSYAVRETVPKVVIIDPDLIRGTPRVLLLSSAIKGIDHAIEGMRQINPSHPHAVLAASGTRRFLNTLWKWPKEMETEQALHAKLVKPDDLLQLQLAAWQSYFFPASVVYGLSHRIGHILGGTFGVPHSLTSCITLAPVLGACSEFYGKKLSHFTPVRSLLSSAIHLSEEIHSTVKNLGLPTRLRDVEIRESDLGTLAELLNINYPKEVADLGDGAEKKLGELLESIW